MFGAAYAAVMTVPPRGRLTPEKHERLAARTRARGRWRTVGYALGALLALIAALVGLALVPEALSVARGEGTMGTFTAEVEDCDRIRLGEVCDWTGSFTGDDGRVVLDDALFDSERPDRPGDTFRVLFPDHGDSSVYVPGDRLPLIVCAGFVVGGLGYLGWRTAAVIRWWRRRHARPIPAVGNNP